MGCSASHTTVDQFNSTQVRRNLSRKKQPQLSQRPSEVPTGSKHKISASVQSESEQHSSLNDSADLQKLLHDLTVDDFGDDEELSKASLPDLLLMERSVVRPERKLHGSLGGPMDVREFKSCTNSHTKINTNQARNRFSKVKKPTLSKGF